MFFVEFQLTSRKGNPNQRERLLCLFECDAINAITNAAAKSASNPISEAEYLFLKSLTQV